MFKPTSEGNDIEDAGEVVITGDEQIQFRFKNRNYNKKTAQVGEKEFFTYESEDKDLDPTMFVMKTRETGTRKSQGMVGTKRLATSGKLSTMLPRKIQKIIFLKPMQVVKPNEER